MENPLISVIIPVYKVEPYLKKCVDSVIAQSYKNLEIILVDDCSPDSCPQICDEYEKTDSRVKVIHHAVNQGVACARNSGLDAVGGDYISFVDSDDIVCGTMIETLYAELIRNSCDIAVCGVKRIADIDNICLSEPSKNGREQIMSGTDAVKKIYSEKDPDAFALWNKLYKAELFDGVRFPPKKVHEDMFAMYRLFFGAERILFTDTELYYYRQRSGSIMHSQKIKISLDNAIDAIDEFGLYCEENITDEALLKELTEMKNVMKADFALDSYYLARRYGFSDDEKKYEEIYRSTASLLYSKKLKFRLFEIHPKLFMLAFRINVMMNGERLDHFK